MLYNTLISVVALVEAESTNEAIAKLTEKVRRLGLEPYAFPDTGDAFISDDQDAEPDIS